MLRRAQASGGVRAVPLFIGSYLAVWALVRAAVLVLAQKLLPAKTAIDLPLALAIAGLGVLIVTTPSLVPGLGPPM